MDNDEKIDWSDSEKIDIRVGTLQEAEVFEEAKKSACKLLINFGDMGQRESTVQLAKLHKTEDLIGKQVMAVLKFPPKQIANI
jgi:tRNA-binding protein